MIGCDVLYRAYDVTQKVGVMSFKSGCDISGEVVMKKIEWVQYLIQGCDVMHDVDVTS